MRYYYSLNFPKHWEDIIEMVEENYAKEYDSNDLLVLSAHHIKTIEKIKEENPNYKKIIVYQLEPLCKNHWWEEDYIISRIKDADEVWDYDLDNIKKLKEYGIDAKYKPFLYSEKLKKIENKENPDIDVLFYGTLTDHRSKIIEIISNCFPFEITVVWYYGSRETKLLDEYIGRSKIILDLQDNYKLEKSFDDYIQKQSRIYYALINNKCVVSEKSKRNYFGDLIVEAEKDDLLNKIQYLLEEDRWKNYNNVSDKFKLLSINDISANVQGENDLMKFNSITVDLTGKVTPLCEIGMEFNSDKCPYSKETTSGHRHPYTPFYDELFSPLRNEELNIAEIGIEKNDSINIWRRYFPLAKIYGYEYNNDYITNAKSQNLLNVQYENFNIQHENSINTTFRRVGVKYDIIIDDSTHLFEDQIRFIKTSIDYIKAGGILIIEDIFRNRSEEDYERELGEIEKYFDKITFVTTEHKDRCSSGWENDKLLVLVRNNVSTEKLSDNPKVFIITPSKRPFNLNSIKKTIPNECEWIIVLDNMVKNNYQIENAIIIKSEQTGFYGNPNRNFGLEYIKNNLNPSDNDWIYVLDDDNILHPEWWNVVSNHLDSDFSILTWGQLWPSGDVRTSSRDTSPEKNGIDTSQYMVRWNVAKDLRFNYCYEADGIYAGEASKKGSVLKLENCLGYYNYLRDYRGYTNESLVSICMISMFKNEAKGILRMLESVWRHIDFYVFQDNGSTDGTPDIIREFFADKNVPGFIYKVEEGWVGFGWNRDHLLQTALNTDHGCDWIMKMDCDEYLEVDDDFNWKLFYNTDIQSFHVTAQSPGCIYYRAWIWNSKLPWKFKHDVAHECIYLDNEIGEGFERFDLPHGLRMVGTSDGESYTVPTKYISDALKLEEQMIREGTMLTDLYHFWYIAKSYMDCYAADFYPLGEEHSKEFVRRFIFYFEEYIKYVNPQSIHEMAYFAAFSIGLGYRYLKEYEKAIWWFNNSEKYCPVRNEHIVYLAETYGELGQYGNMFEQSSRLLQPDRKLPFPDYYFLLDNTIYCDSGPVPQQLYQYSLEKCLENQNQDINSFSINIKTKPRLWIVDNFYHDPHSVREFALNQEYQEDINWYKGSRSIEQFIIPGTKEAFEKIIGKKITKWTESHGMCGRFQYCTAQDDLVYHCDDQTFAGMVYLTPNAPFSCGTSFFSHKKTGLRNENDFGNVDIFSETGYYDRSKFELVDTAGNVFNRLVLFDSKCIHSANEYFGTDITNSRLFHLFFFDCNEI